VRPSRLFQYGKGFARFATLLLLLLLLLPLLQVAS